MKAGFVETSKSAWMLILFSVFPAAADNAVPRQRLDYDLLAQEVSGLERHTADDEALLYSGKMDQAIIELRDYANTGGPERRFGAANMLWKMSPEVAMALHEEVLSGLPDDPSVIFEAALGRTRGGLCKEAISLWEKLKAGAGIPDHAAYVASYCYLETGDYSGAVAIVDRSRVRSVHVSAEKLSYSVFGGPYGFQQYDDAFKRAEAGDARGLDEVILHAFGWVHDWWNIEPRRPALARVRALMSKRLPADSPIVLQWDCMWESLVNEDALDVADIGRCEIMVDDHPYPSSSALGELILAKVADMDTHADLLERHGEVLWARASGVDGDPSALRVLAFLQARVPDPEGLARSNVLGWERYGELRYAKSLVISLQAESSSDYAFTVDRAIVDFPHSPLLQLLRIALKYSDGNVPAADVARLIQSEIRTFELSEAGGMRSSVQVSLLYRRLAGLVADEAISKAVE